MKGKCVFCQQEKEVVRLVEGRAACACKECNEQKAEEIKKMLNN